MKLPLWLEIYTCMLDLQIDQIILSEQYDTSNVYLTSCMNEKLYFTLP